MNKLVSKIFSNNPHIAVIGDLMLDEFLYGNSTKVSPEAPVPVVKSTHKKLFLGGAGNVVRTLVSLGSNVDLYSVLGNDEDSSIVKKLLNELKVDISNLHFLNDRCTTKKTRIISSRQQMLRIDNEEEENISLETEELIFRNLKKNINTYDVILISDYGKGLLTNDLIKKIIYLCNTNNTKVMIDPKGNDFAKYSNSFLLTPNKKEITEALNVKIQDNDSILKALDILKDKYNINVPLITLSEDGIAFLNNNGLSIYPTSAKEVFDVTGAGDTVLASLGFAISNNLSIDDAVCFANICAGIVVQKIGTSSPTISEVKEAFNSPMKPELDSKIKSVDEIEDIVKIIRDKNESIAFTNGCFDILHIGHIKYLEMASKLSDKLIVGVNSDNSVRNLKGESRPYNSDYERMFLISALSFVDYVVLFNEDTPINLISLVKPDILVKGGDYKISEVVGSEYAKEVKIIDFVKDRSTTNLVNKIKEVECNLKK